MEEIFENSKEPMLPGMSEPISSPELEDGTSRSISPDGDGLSKDNWRLALFDELCEIWKEVSIIFFREAASGD